MNSPVKLDVLAIAAHPDDAELACSGTLVQLKKRGYKIGILDLTRGELGTRGTPELRELEAKASAEILGLDFRANLNFRDGFFENEETHQLALIQWIRHLQPRLVLANAPEDRHPDHGRAGSLALQACFYSGLSKVVTHWEGNLQPAYRPEKVWQYIQDRWIQPSVVIEISDSFETKIASIKAFASQFYNPGLQEPETYISSPDFWHQIESRARTVGHLIGVRYGEGFILPGPVEIKDPLL
ncbi:MAG: bacillithiol biosynthesis deacetylase BshB1 [Sphingobacteriia bacterium]|nr:bacillithiol biosynthesis deacetylase BshB1 [Sphingobacteriia bacterium]